MSSSSSSSSSSSTALSVSSIDKRSFATGAFVGATVTALFAFLFARRQLRSAQLTFLAFGAAQFVQRYLALHSTSIPALEECIEEVLAARERALRVFKYRCIEFCSFADPRIHKHPAYTKYLVRSSSSNLRVLDVGCCMGADLRQILVDDITTPENVLGVDLEEAFFEIGFGLFRDASSMRPRLTQVNVLDEASRKSNPTFLKFVGGGVDVLSCQAVFHLLTEEQGIELTRVIFDLLKPGGVFFGSTAGSTSSNPILLPDERAGGRIRHYHTSSSFSSLLSSNGFSQVSVQVRSARERDPTGGAKLKQGETTGAFFFSAVKPKAGL